MGRKLGQGISANESAAGADCAHAAGSGRHKERAGSGQPSRCGSDAVAGAQRVPLAGPAGAVGQLIRRTRASGAGPPQPGRPGAA